MVSRIRQLLAAPVFEDDEDKTRVAGLLNIILMASLVLSVMVVIASPIVFPDPVPSLVATGVLILLQLSALFLMRRGWVQLASVLLLSALWLVVTLWVFASGGVRSTGFSTYIVLILLAGLLLGGRTGIVFAGLNVAAGIGVLYAEISGLLPSPFVAVTSGSLLMTQTVHFILAAVLLYLANRSIYEALERARRYAAELEEHKESLEETVEERTRDLARRAHYLEATSDVAQDATSVLDPQNLLSRVVALVSERFGFDHTGIFLLDATGEWAVLTAASSEGGQRMLARGHRLRVGEEGIVGYVAGRGEPRVALDVGADAMFLDNPDFPHTRSEMALPLRVRGEIIGALDVQSEEPEAFSDEDVAVLQTLADQVATAISNARLHDQAQQEIAERKRAEEALKEYSERLEEMVEERTQELRDAQEQLIRQGELAVLGQLAGGVSHELRNPLAAIKNAAYFLNMVLEDPDPEVKETLEILDKEVAASERTISSLLDYARTRRPTWRKVDIKEVLDEALSRARVPENIEVVSQSDGRLPIILVDPGQLLQVFGNIIRNAVQAMSEGGRLVVKSEVPSPEWIAVSFADTGVGIPEENLGKLFEPLFTTKAKGIGLGLAVTKTLVEGHGGTIEVESQVGKGTTFRVRLPIADG